MPKVDVGEIFNGTFTLEVSFKDNHSTVRVKTFARALCCSFGATREGHSKAAMESLADTLLHGSAVHTELWYRPEPPLGAVLSEDRHGEACPSRMPCR